ncbi:MAG TPA: hypothetical protein VMD59_15845, partial [Acidimicrobiales bacterium]|nr:hypothetical protein [Acidimicrobiales bacterium]
MTALRGITWDHPRGLSPLLALAAGGGRRGDIDVDWSARSLQAFGDLPPAELAGNYDLLVIDHPHVPLAAGEGLLVALDGDRVGGERDGDERVGDERDGDERDGELAALAARSVGRSHDSYRFMGRQWALAIDAAAQVSAHRPDLITD